MQRNSHHAYITDTFFCIFIFRKRLKNVIENLLTTMVTGELLFYVHCTETIFYYFIFLYDWLNDIILNVWR